MITKIYKVECDGCGKETLLIGHRNTAEYDYRRKGGIIDSYGHHFCNRTCKKLYESSFDLSITQKK